ncbi:MAG: AI-2E family transporter [Chloroflexi bacterium]|nr:AI-2E family transporter [Chloroflexota bacterium]
MTAQRARLALWVSTAALVCYVAYLSSYTLIPFLVGAVIAYALAPIVDRLLVLVPLRHSNQLAIRRGLAVLIIYLVFFGLLTVALLSLIPIAVEQIAHFIEELPAITESARQQTMGLLHQYQQRTPPEVQARINALAEQGASAAASVAATVVQATVFTVTSTVGFLFGLAIVPFWMFYVMRDRHLAGPNFVRAAPVEVREDVRMMLSLADRLLGRYIRAQLILGLAVGGAVGVLMALMGVELSLGLGVWAGVTELIPIIGPWAGAIPGLILVAATDPSLLPWVALTYLMVQQVENNFLVPRIQGQALDLHPAMVILLLVVGGAVFGFIGLVVIIPLAAIVRELFWYLDRRLQGQTPEQAFAASHVNGGKRATSDEPLPPAAAQPLEVTH